MKSATLQWIGAVVGDFQFTYLKNFSEENLGIKSLIYKNKESRSNFDWEHESNSDSSVYCKLNLPLIIQLLSWDKKPE